MSPPLRTFFQISRSEILPLAADILVVADCLSVALAGAVCADIYASYADSQGGHDLAPTLSRISCFGALVTVSILRDSSLGSVSYLSSIAQLGFRSRAIRRVGGRFALVIGLLLGIGFLTHVFSSIPRVWAVSWGASAFILVISIRIIFVDLISRSYEQGALRERVAVIGSGAAVASVVSHLNNDGSRGIQVIGVYNDETPPAVLAGSASTGGLNELIELGKSHHLDRVILVSSSMAQQRWAAVVARLKALDIEVAVCPDVAGFDVRSARLGQIAGLPVLVLADRPIQSWGLLLKATEDLLFATMLLMLTFPVALIIAIAIKIESGGPILFRQRRHGWNNTEFDVFKFRTMRVDGHVGDGSIQTARQDKRVTAVGRLLRKTSLDELPQLLNVLRGEMSLVGPRPHPVAMRTQDRLGDEIIAEYAHRHRVKPGLTGWAQVNGSRGATDTAEQIRKRVEYDLYYIENWSLLLDLKILLLTPYKLIADAKSAF